MHVTVGKVGKGGKIKKIDNKINTSKVVANKRGEYGKANRGGNTPKVVVGKLDMGPTK